MIWTAVWLLLSLLKSGLEGTKKKVTKQQSGIPSIIIPFKIIFLYILFMVLIFPGKIRGENRLTKSLLTEKPGVFLLTEEWIWKYHPGDNKQWAEPGYDHHLWENICSSNDIKNIMKTNWYKIGWFRCHFRVDETLQGKPAVLHIRHLGASEVFLNGKSIHRIGQIKTPKSIEETPEPMRMKAFTFDNHSSQVIAVRYFNDSTVTQQRMGFNTGFDLLLMDFDKTLLRGSQQIRLFTKYETLLTAIPLILALLHLLLFLFYPKMKENLFYSFCLIGFAAFFYTIMNRYMTPDPGEMIFYYRIGPILNTLTISFLLLTSYSIVYAKIPKRYRYFIVSAVVIGIWGAFKPLGLINIGLFLFTSLLIFESLRVFIRHWPREKKGAWIILIGIITLAILSVYQIGEVIVEMIAYQMTEPPRSFFRVHTYGGPVFIICMSIYLSYHFSRINKNLETKLVQVKELSEKNLLQERQTRQLEIERRLLEAENERKSKELEEARKLQLSMLPQKIPQRPDLEIDVFMKTATEVGGDYYDFHIGKDGTLTAVIGDATGHGMKAGTMVTAVKSLFGTYNEAVIIPEFFNNCTKIIKGMNLGHLYMAMMILQVKKNKIIASTAGMPPALISRKKSQTIDEIFIKGPPLGGFVNFSYQQEEAKIGKGDILLLMSDGFPELFNQKDEMLGMTRVKRIFKETIKDSPGDIIASLNEAGEKWSKGRTQEDDITFLVIKWK
jgi:serine phosphatase RsbU (regulator of sigma subunit)